MGGIWNGKTWARSPAFKRVEQVREESSILFSVQELLFVHMTRCCQARLIPWSTALFSHPASTHPWDPNRNNLYDYILALTLDRQYEQVKVRNRQYAHAWFDLDFSNHPTANCKAFLWARNCGIVDRRRRILLITGSRETRNYGLKLICWGASTWTKGRTLA